MFRLSAELARVPFIDVPLRADFSLPLDAMLAAIEKHQPPLIFIAYPNNPTGTLFERAAVEAIIQASTGLVVIDEAYAAFSPDSFVDALPAHPHLLVMRTLSKLGLAGIRLGYLLGAPQLLAQIDKVRPPYNVNVLTQCCAQFVFDHMSVFKAQTEALLAAREQLAQALAMRPGLTVFASHANFLLFRLQSADLGAASRVDSALRARGVLIKNVSSSHPLLSNGLRVTVSTPQENAAFLSALDAIWPAARSA
jgi:histidinol-phosphate aminotransferase